MAVFHTIDPKDVWLGDHLYIWKHGLYQHHGVVFFVDKDDPDNSRVLEFNSDPNSADPTRLQIQEVSLKQFRGTCTLKRVMYNSRFAAFKLAGTTHREESLPPEHVADNALLVLEQVKFGDCLLTPNDPMGTEATYNLLLRNCECLAYWCKTGRWFSDQVEKAIDWTLSAVRIIAKHITKYMVTREPWVRIGQEVLSEAIEGTVPSIAKSCHGWIQKEALGNAIALIIVEIIKVAWRLYQAFHGQITWKEFAEKTIRSLVNGFMSAAFAIGIQALIVAISGGTGATVVTFAAGLLGAILGPLVGNLLMDYLTKKILTGNESEPNDNAAIAN